ncbi:hypothetical protein QLQ32_11000 [Enterococcus faecalis]|nr:hypothetical protein [Enterococcus faecalis]WHK85757.1 hypothetical protein QLQ32_11000 [Enterococcus faecalis]
MKNSTFLKDLFAIDKANDELFRLVGVAICMAIPLLIGYFSNNLLIGTFGSMGIYTFIYYQPLPLPQLLRRLNIVGFFYCSGQQLRNAKSPCTLVDSHYNCHRRFSCTLTF